MKVFILGAGYVGTALLADFKKQGIAACASTTREEKVDFLKTHTDHVYVLKSSDMPQLKAVIDQCDAMVILVAPKNSARYEETYLSTAKAVASILKERTGPFTLIYTSSTGVYQGTSCEWVDETTPLSPPSENTKILIETEKTYLNCQNSFINVCILRLAGIYGHGRDLAERANQFSGKEMEGNGHAFTNHIHLEDIVAGIKFCFTHSLQGIYNLANDDHPTRRELYDGLCKKNGLPPPIWKSCDKKENEKGYRVSSDKILQAGFALKGNRLMQQEN